MAYSITNNTFIAPNQDMTGDFTSSTIFCDHLTDTSLQVIILGTPVGTLTLQISNNAKNDGTGDFVDYSSAAVTSAGSIIFNDSNAGYLAVRVKYTHTSGSGTCNGVFFGKGF